MNTEIQLHDVDRVEIVTNRKTDGGHFIELHIVQHGHQTELILWPKDNQPIQLLLGESE